MTAVKTQSRKGATVEWQDVYPSLFGLYGTLPLDGPDARLFLEEPVAASMVSGQEGFPRLRIKTESAMAEFDVEVANDTEDLRNSLLSRWMRDHYHSLPGLPLGSVLSLIISQATPTPRPVWPNARLKICQWDRILSHALETDDPHMQSARIVAGLALESDMLKSLRRGKSASSVLLGLNTAMESADPRSINIVHRMAGRVTRGEGVLVVAERGNDDAARARIREVIPKAGWLAFVGNRPLEKFALEIAGSRQVPAVLLDSDKMKSSPVLDNVDLVMTFGDENRFGVMRRRAIEMVGELKES